MDYAYIHTFNDVTEWTKQYCTYSTYLDDLYEYSTYSLYLDTSVAPRPPSHTPGFAIH